MPKMKSKFEKLDVMSLIGRSDQVETKIPPQLYYGPRRAGKSTLAATASAQWDTERERSRDSGMLVLEDVLWLPFDAGALDALKPWNVTVQHVLPWDRLLAGYGDRVTEALKAVQDGIADYLAQTPDIKFLVIDTLSQLDWHLEADLTGRVEDSQTLYRTLLGYHRSFAGFLKRAPVSVIQLCHSRMVGEARSKKGDAKALDKDKLTKASKYFVRPDIEPAITGKGGEIYRSNTSIQGVVLAKKVVGQKLPQRKVYFNLTDGFEASSRFEGILDPEGEGMQPNLREIYNLVGYDL